MSSSIAIDRTTLSLSTLTIPSASYGLNAFNPGDVTWQRAFAESRFVNDGSLIAARRQSTQITATLEAIGSTPGALQTAEAALVAALSQFAYALSWTETGSPGATYTWSCWPADIAPAGDGFFAPDRGVFVQVFQVTIPRKSVPVSGSF